MYINGEATEGKGLWSGGSHQGTLPKVAKPRQNRLEREETSEPRPTPPLPPEGGKEGAGTERWL